MEPKTPKRQTGLGTSAFFRTTPSTSSEAPPPDTAPPPTAGEDVEELTMPPAPQKPAARPVKQATAKAVPSKARQPDVPPENPRREKIGYSLAEVTVNRLEALKSHYRLSYRSRTTYGKLLDEAVRLLAEKEGLL